MTAAPMRDGGPQELMRGYFPATQDAVAAVLRKLRRALDAEAVADGAADDILLVMGEILNNVVEHSVAGISDAQIEIEVLRDADRVLVEVGDRGRPLPPSLLTSAELPAVPDDPEDIAALPEGGFGWFIIHALAQDMLYEREGGANRLSFHFAI